MCKEILSLHVGQAGVQSSHALWELICIEHGIGADGIMRESHDKYQNPGENISAIFSETKNSRYVPRAVLMDLEPTVMDEVRTGAYRQLWNPSNLVNQKEDAASNYARGYYTSGRLFLTIVTDRINREIERCDNLAAFEIVHSFAGGTGSGFSSLLGEKLSDSHGKVFKFSLGVFPSPRLSEIMVESYNTVLHTHTTIENEDCVVLFDNESLFNKSLDKLRVSQPTFSLMNRLVSQMFSSISLSHRYNFFGSQHADVTELLTNLIPYPRIHFPIMSYSPLITYDQQQHEIFDCSKLTNDVFRDQNQVIQCNIQGNKFMSCCMLYRGSVSPKPIIDAIARIKTRREINFVEWCPTGFKIGINTCPPIQIPNCEQAVGDNALCMVSGNTAIRESWSSLIRKFDMLMSKKAFVHWYVSEGLEDGEFIDAREDIQSLVLDYDELTNHNINETSNNESENYRINKENVKRNVNFSNRNNYILSNVTNRRLNLPLLENRYNQSDYTDEFDEVDTNSLPGNKLIDQSFRSKKSFDKSEIQKPRPKISNSDIAKPTFTQSRNKNLIQLFDKCQKTIIKTQNVIDKNKPLPSSKQKRGRNNTKDLEIRDIQSTVSKYLGTHSSSSATNLIIQKSFQIPLKRKPISPESMQKISKSPVSPVICESDVNVSESYCSSRHEFKQGLNSMKNNNKGKSSMSSIFGSFKTDYDNELKLSLTGANKSIVVNQLLYRSFDKNVTNNLGNLNYSERQLHQKSEFENKPLPLSIVSEKGNANRLSYETLKQSSESGETKLLEDNRSKYLEFSKIEIIVCDPYGPFERSPSFALL